MQKRHIDQIQTRLDDLRTKGSCNFSDQELYYWFSVQKIAKTPWREILNYWMEIVEGSELENVNPLIIKRDGIYTLFLDFNAESLTDKAL